MTIAHDILIYIQGLPGSSEELNFLSQNDSRRVHVFGPQSQDEIDEFVNSNVGQRLHIIGFSLGAMAAIKLSTRYATVASMMSLISPAAPLELGNFLSGMAGRFVFQSASRSNWQFNLLTAFQKAGVSLSSDFVINTMFKGSPESDIALLKDLNFKRAIEAGLKETYGINNSAYRQQIREYVQPWAQNLTYVKCPVKIYHGEADNWAPIGMAYALQEHIASNTEVIEYSELGHFSTLKKALPLIIKINNSAV